MNWFANYDTGRLSCWFELDQPGWLLVLSFASYEGAVQLIGAGAHYAGDVDPMDVVQGLSEGPVPDMATADGFRYRWLRDISQQYEQGARSYLRAHPDEVAWLLGDDWYESDAPKKGYGTRFYAEAARDFLVMGGRYEALASHRSVSDETAKGWIKKARKLGVLTSPGRGRRGHSDLTDIGRQVLDGKH